ncbi:Hypothetical protein HDN1F_18810 [gamma proteobacterium HdN1]|nr:Hypothetical protein HDN1F_18810 [gamma proteobacterium HdN1]
MPSILQERGKTRAYYPPHLPPRIQGSGMPAADGIPLKIPPQDLAILSFAQPNAKRVREWVNSLPQMNVGETSKQVYAAVQELTRLRTDSETRFQMLEALRGPIHFICNALSKHFLDKAVVLPPREAKIANLAQALQNHLATGYKVVASQVLERSRQGDRAARMMITRALHRALTEMLLVMLRSHQLYFPAPPGYWRETHQIFLLAESLNILDQNVEDDQEQQLSTTIYDAYRRSLLMATARPNQLRQTQHELVHQATASWFRYCDVLPLLENKGLYTLNLDADTPPAYAALQKLSDERPLNRCFDASRVSDLLRTQLQLSTGQTHPESGFTLPSGMLPDLIRILIQAWGVLTERAFTRIEEAGQIRLCIGLSATHYFVSDRQDFARQMRNVPSAMLQLEESNRFMAGGPTHRRDVIDETDVWGLQLDRHVTMGNKASSIEEQVLKHDQKQQESVESDKYPSYSCDIINTSPGGFCVGWKQDIPPHVKTGEIIGVKEHEDQPWSIGVIRWVKQFRNEGARMGIELLAPRADACGTQVIQKKGGATEFMRTLILPELRAIGQPATLITPNIAFAVGSKINLNQNSTISKAQLIKQVGATASFCQFQFKQLSLSDTETPSGPTSGSSKPAAKTGKEDDFDSIWSSL